MGTVSEPETLASPTCAECGRRPLPGERWSLRFADLGEVVAYCPDCDEREFADTTRNRPPVPCLTSWGKVPIGPDGLPGRLCSASPLRTFATEARRQLRLFTPNLFVIHWRGSASA
jgi:hypothetical protein